MPGSSGPGRVASHERDGTPMAEVDFGGVRKEVCLAYMPDVQVGEYVDRARRLRDPAARRGSPRRRRSPTSSELGMLEEEFGDGLRRAPAGGPPGRREHAMKYLDEFSDPDLAAQAARPDPRRRPPGPGRSWRSAAGRRTRSSGTASTSCCPTAIEMIHGPGCPVCVTPLEIIDKALAIAAQPGVIFCSFGDMLRVPGSGEDLFRGQERRAATCASSTRRSTR